MVYIKTVPLQPFYRPFRCCLLANIQEYSGVFSWHDTGLKDEEQFPETKCVCHTAHLLVVFFVIASQLGLFQVQCFLPPSCNTTYLRTLAVSVLT